MSAKDEKLQEAVSAAKYFAVLFCLGMIVIFIMAARQEDVTLKPIAPKPAASKFDPVANRLQAELDAAGADAQLANYVHRERAEKIAKAIRHEAVNTANGGLIDSFEFPGDKLEVCELSYPGPVYACR